MYPITSADAYISRLIAKGYKVAICEQMEDPATAKGLVERDIIRIITPGTVIASSMLDEGRNNFLCFSMGQRGTGLCFCDISTGEISVTSFTGRMRTSTSKRAGPLYPPGGHSLRGGLSDEALRTFLSSGWSAAARTGAGGPLPPGHRPRRRRTAVPRRLNALPDGDDACGPGGGGPALLPL